LGNKIDDGLHTKIDVDTAIKELGYDGRKLRIIEHLKEGYGIRYLCDMLDFNRNTTSLLIKKMCGEIAEYLGWEYSDKKIIEEFRRNND
jgi:hypothetical protein